MLLAQNMRLVASCIFCLSWMNLWAKIRILKSACRKESCIAAKGVIFSLLRTGSQCTTILRAQWPWFLFFSCTAPSLFRPIYPSKPAGRRRAVWWQHAPNFERGRERKKKVWQGNQRAEGLLWQGKSGGWMQRLRRSWPKELCERQHLWWDSFRTCSVGVVRIVQVLLGNNQNLLHGVASLEGGEAPKLLH